MAAVMVAKATKAAMVRATAAVTAAKAAVAAVATVATTRAAVATVVTAAATAVLGPGTWKRLILMMAIQFPGELAHPPAAEVVVVVVETDPSVTTQGMTCAWLEDLGVRKVKKAAISLEAPMTTRGTGPGTGPMVAMYKEMLSVDSTP